MDYLWDKGVYTSGQINYRPKFTRTSSRRVLEHVDLCLLVNHSSKTCFLYFRRRDPSWDPVGTDRDTETISGSPT